MKKILFSLLAACVLSVTAAAQTMNVHLSDGSTLKFTADQVNYVDFTAAAPTLGPFSITFNKLLDAYTWDEQYYTDGRTKVIWLTKDSINTAQSVLDKYNYTKEKVYNELLKKVQYEGSQTWSVSTSYPNVQYEFTLEADKITPSSDYQLKATIVYKKTANYNYSPANMLRRIRVLARDVNSDLVDSDLGYDLLFNADFPATVTYSYGTNLFYKEFTSRWDGDSFAVGFNWEAVNSAYNSGRYYYYKEISLTEAFENYYKYSVSPYNLTYTFELQKDQKDTLSYGLDVNTINLTTSYDIYPSLSASATVAQNAYLNIMSPVKNTAPTSNAVAYSDVKIKVAVKEKNGYIINDPNTTETRRDLKNQPYIFNLAVKLPLSDSDITIMSDDSVYNHSLGVIAANTPYNVIKYVQINSTKCLTAAEPQTEGVVFVKDGSLVTVDISVGGMIQSRGKVLGWNPNLSYEIVKAVNDNGQGIIGDNSFIFDAHNGTITFPNPHNITNDWTFTIRVKLDYTFGSMSKEYKVVAPKQTRD